MLETHQDIEPTSHVISSTASTLVIVETEDVKRGATPDQDHPGSILKRYPIGELHVQGNHDKPIAESHLGIGSERKVVQERGGLDVTAKEELTRVRADADADACLSLGHGPNRCEDERHDENSESEA